METLEAIQKAEEVLDEEEDGDEMRRMTEEALRGPSKSETPVDGLREKKGEEDD